MLLLTKKVVVALFAVLWPVVLPAGVAAAEPDSNGLYGQRIVLETVAEDGKNRIKSAGKVTTKEIAADLSNWLGQVTGKTFETINTQTEIPKSGIILLNVNSRLVAADARDRLKDKGKEAFVLRSEGDARLWIVGNTDLAVRHGAYHYLERLGCRWYLPNDHWKIIPSLQSITLNINRVDAPVYRSREFFGTGGFGGALAIDPKMTLQATWEQWKSFNRLGGEIRLSGHTGEAFNTAHKKELAAHPEFLAEINGKRQSLEGPSEIITKPCISNPELRRLYIDWTLARFKNTYEADPEGPSSWGVSVEPADGAGQCECEQCKKIGKGSDSDKVFFLANETAKAVSAKYPGKKVSLLAYGDHAAVPSFSLEPNVSVWVTPYAFQRTGLTGDELLAAWGKQRKELGLYHYFAIPDWSNCLPALDYRGALSTQIRRWHENSVDALQGESSFSAGNVGIFWYVASRLLWDPSADTDALLNDFYTKSFGPAAPPMRRMLERWCDYGQYMLCEHELGLTFRDLQEALRLAPDDATRSRINDFALYVQYLRLWHEYEESRRTTKPAENEKDREQVAAALLDHCWRIYGSAMVHSYRMHMLIVKRYLKGRPEAQRLDEKWPLYDLKAGCWRTIKPVTSEEIARFVAEGVQRFKPVEFESRRFSKKLVPLKPLDRSWKPATEWVTSPSLIAHQECLFWAGEGVSQVEIQFRCGGARSATQPARQDHVIITDPHGKKILDTFVEEGEAWNVLKVPTAVAGLYQMKVADQKVGFLLKVPSNLPFVLKERFVSTDLSPRVYFLVPKGLRRAVFYAQGVVPFDLFDSDGSARKEKVNGFVAFDVPQDKDGMVWSFAKFKGGWDPIRVMNYPALFAFSAEGLIVPEEVVSAPVPKKP